MRTRLTQVQAIQLADWLRARRDSIETSGADPKDVASHIRQDLGLAVVPSSILRIAKTVGIRFRQSRSSSPRRDQVTQLAGCIAELFDRLGEERPDVLADLLAQGNCYE